MKIATVSESKAFEQKVSTLLGENFSYKSINPNDTIENTLRRDNIDCVIFEIQYQVQLISSIIENLKQKFPVVPHVCITPNDIDFDVIRRFGVIGVERVLSLSRLAMLKRVINDLIIDNCSKVYRYEFGLKDEYPSKILNQTIYKIEEEYLNILNTSELAQYVEVTDSTLSREFKKYDLISPKRLLLYFKVSHALKLMRNQGLSMKEIIHLSGFTSEKRFYDFFAKLLPYSPGECRKLILVKGMNGFWCEVGKTILMTQ